MSSTDQIIFFIESKRQWYIADAAGKSNSCSKLCDMPPFVLYFGTPVILGSCIYYLGGCFTENCSSYHSLGGLTENFRKFRSSMVFVFDILYPEKGWVKGSSMGAVRLSPTAVSVAGRIYVFGGHDCFDFPVVEVFDPNSSSWKPLSFRPLFPADIIDNTFTVLGVIGREILVHLRDKLYLYNADTESFKLKDNNYTCCFQTDVVSADGNILWHYMPEDLVKGYDLVEHRWFSRSFKIETPETKNRISLVTLRDHDFGLVFSTALDDDDGKICWRMPRFFIIENV